MCKIRSKGVSTFHGMYSWNIFLDKPLASGCRGPERREPADWKPVKGCLGCDKGVTGVGDVIEE